MRRVVVTGLGAITPLAVGVRPTWRRLLDSHSGIVSVADLEPQDKWKELTSTVAGLVPTASRNKQNVSEENTWKAADWLEPSDQRRMSLFAQYSVAATEMALQDAGWKPTRQEDLEATGVCMGSGIGNLDDFYSTSVTYDKEVRAPARPLIGPDLRLTFLM